MGNKQIKGWLKHADFILLDLLLVQASFFLMFMFLNGTGSMYTNPNFSHQIAQITIAQLITDIFGDNYHNILTRKKFEELWALGKYVLWIVLLTLSLSYIFKTQATPSRVFLFGSLCIGCVLSFSGRSLLKYLMRHFNKNNTNKRSVVLMTDKKHIRSALQKMNTGAYQNFFVPFVVTIGNDMDEDFSDLGMPVYPYSQKALNKIRLNWVDEVFVLQPDTMLYPTQIIDTLNQMGIMVNYTVTSLNEDTSPVTSFNKLGEFKVITNNVRLISSGEKIMKRLIDIVGSIVGLLLTGILIVIVGPLIYRADPGPIFYSQKRVGQNGKTFNIYKFRTMYRDADAKKEELQKQNKMSDGMMFKMMIHGS